MAQNLMESGWDGWKVVRKIGEGSFGGVYEIQRTLPGGEVERAALKRLAVPRNKAEITELISQQYDTVSITAHFAEQMQELVREYTFMQKLSSNPNVVHCQDMRTVQHKDGIGWDIFIRMELLTPLKQYLGKDYIFDEELVIRLGLDMCNALRSCHEKNIIHRDIKPENIMVDADGHFKLGDFGIAKISEKTATGTLTGTYSYMAPEIANRQHYGISADIYSLGLVMYWLMNERALPFLQPYPQIPTAAQRQEAQERRFSGEALPKPFYGSKELTRIVMKACAYDSQERYHSVEEMAEEIRNIGATQNPMQVLPQPQAKHPRKQKSKRVSARKKQLGKIAAAGILVLLVVCLISGFVLLNKSEGPGKLPASAAVKAENGSKDTDLMPAVSMETTEEITEPLQIPCERIEVSGEKKIELESLGQSYLLKAEKFPVDSTDAVVYTSENEDILIADENGTITAIGYGITKIRITCGEQSAAVIAKVGKTFTMRDRLGVDWDNTTYFWKQNKYDRDSVRSVIFQSTMADCPKNAWDVSENQDGSVMAWVEDGVLTIGASGLISLPKHSRNLFSFANLQSVLWNNCVVTDNVTDMSCMFYYCNSLTSLDLSGFDTANVTYMESMFYKCNSLTSLDLSSFDTASVIDMTWMFNHCESLTSLDLSGFNTVRVRRIGAMFIGCNSLTSLDLSGFDTANVTDMSGMFEYCENLVSLNLTNLDTTNVTNMSSMFSGCMRLTSLDLTSFDTTNVTNMSSMFSGCTKLASLDLTCFDTANVTNMRNIFSGCYNLTSIKSTDNRILDEFKNRMQ